MSSLPIALVTCVSPPEPDRDEGALVRALSEAGATPRVVAWDDPAVRWADHRLAVVRSTWNYFHRRDDFLAWAERTSRETNLENPFSIFQWNSHKRYLADLERSGVAIVPTEWITKGASIPLRSLLEGRGWEDAVVKPAVSAGSFETHRVNASTLEGFERRFREMCSRRDVMVQPYLRSVEGYGERSIISIDGELTHAVRKSSRFSRGEENVSEALSIADDEREVAQSILSRVPGPLLYARVDLARGERGAPVLMELELIEPSLFLLQSPSALERFARAIVRRARGAI